MHFKVVIRFIDIVMSHDSFRSFELLLVSAKRFSEFSVSALHEDSVCSSFSALSAGRFLLISSVIADGEYSLLLPSPNA